MTKLKVKTPSAQNFEYDMLVIGSGPAGVYAAVQASKLGKRVAIIEKNADKLGGAWIHTGTLPSKTMREVLATIQSIQFHAGKPWVERLVSDLSFSKLMDRANRVAKSEEDLIRRHLQTNNIAVIHGSGVIEDANTVRVNTTDGKSKLIRTDKVMLATGSRPRRPDNIPFDGWRVVDSDEILNLEQVPKSLVIYGAGVIGCEYACIFGALGVDTTIVDERNNVLQSIDREIAEALKRSMEDLGIKFKMGQKLDHVKTDGPRVTAKFKDFIATSDVFFFSAGRLSNTAHLGLEKIGVRVTDRGAVHVNEFFQTSVNNVYATGDVIGPPALAATSMEQGRFACLHAFDECQRSFPTIFPIGIYTIPELSSVGKTEEEIKAEGLPYVVGHASFDEVARGHIRGDNHGMLKIIAHRETQEILGLHIVGADACNLVHIGQALMLQGAQLHDLVDRMIFNYPTLAEAYRVAAFNALNKLRIDNTEKSVA